MTATTTRPAWSDDDLEAFRDLAHSFLEKECAPHEQRWAEQQHVDREVWNKAGELGLLCPSIPEQYGGGGGTFAHEAVLAEEQVRTGAPSLGTAVHSTIVAHYLNGYGTEEQKRTFLPQLASGELVGAVAMTEPGTGSDLQAVATKAIRDGDSYVIDGSKTFISNGLQAEFIVVVAKTDPENKAAGISLICVDTRGLEGFSRGRVLKKIGQHGQDTAELFFDGVRVPTSNLLGEVEGQGFIQLMQQLPQERLVLAVAAIAAIEETIAVTLKYTKERHAFGKPGLQLPEHEVQAGRGGDERQDRPRVHRRLHRQAPAGPTRRAHRLDGQVVAHPAAVRHRRRVPAVLRWLRLHGGVPDLADVHRCADPEDLRRHQRDHEGDHQPLPVSGPAGDRVWCNRVQASGRV